MCPSVSEEANDHVVKADRIEDKGLPPPGQPPLLSEQLSLGKTKAVPS